MEAPMLPVLISTPDTYLISLTGYCSWLTPASPAQFVLHMQRILFLADPSSSYPTSWLPTDISALVTRNFEERPLLCWHIRQRDHYVDLFYIDFEGPSAPALTRFSPFSLTLATLNGAQGANLYLPPDQLFVPSLAPTQQDINLIKFFSYNIFFIYDCELYVILLNK